jgi:hypothetical protein
LPDILEATLLLCNSRRCLVPVHLQKMAGLLLGQLADYITTLKLLLQEKRVRDAQMQQVYQSSPATRGVSACARYLHSFKI